MNKKFNFIVLIMSLLSLCLSSFSLYKILAPQDVQYVIYLGTNAADSNEPVFSHEEAKNEAEKILFRHFSGFTIQEANGGWLNDDGSEAHEYTLVIYLSDTTRDKIYKVSNEMLKIFKQSSVLIQTNTTQTEFYSGGK